MKKALFVMMWCAVTGCSQPRPVTGNPDDQTSTSGTLGSVKATNETPRKAGNTTVTEDSLKRVSDSTRPN